MRLEPQRQVEPELPLDLREHIDELFPHGLSDHGRRYFVLGELTDLERTIEMTWEYVRRAHFQHRPSRFMCTYAWQTLEEASVFAAAHGGAPVWEVSSAEAFVGNMRLLVARTSAVRVSQLAHSYWQGLKSPRGVQLDTQPTWEVLLPPSATVVRLAA